MKKLNICIIDDSPMQTTLLQAQLTHMFLNTGYELLFKIYESADAACQSFRNNRFKPSNFSLIFLDYHMPRMSGLQFIEIAPGFGISLADIIMVTGDSCSAEQKEKNAEKAKQKGVETVLFKPSYLSELTQEMARRFNFAC